MILKLHGALNTDSDTWGDILDNDVAHFSWKSDIDYSEMFLFREIDSGSWKNDTSHSDEWSAWSTNI